MIGLGIVITLTGYAVTYYGLTQLMGGNWTFAQLVIPSKWSPAVAAIARDGAKK